MARMEIVETIAGLRAARQLMAGPVGVLLTLGALHEGHLTLAQRARAENKAVIVTVFVNPTQFNNPTDLAAYPRDLERDVALLADSGVDLLFAPHADEIYPPDFQTYVTVEKISQGLEGDHRPGHFRGVATVVSKLFHLTQPDKAYFGQKDAQQVALIRQMVKDLQFPLELVICPTVREADGLAMSSRNQNLSPEERKAAPVLYRALQAAQRAHQTGELQASALRDIMLQILAGEPLAQVDYVSVADTETLEELSGPIQVPALLSLAVTIGRTRLIDNLILPV